MSKRKSRLAIFLSRVLKWARHEPDPPADSTATQPKRFPRLKMKRACSRLDGALSQAAELLEQVEGRARSGDLCEMKSQRRNLYKVHRRMADATQQLTRVLLEVAGEIDPATMTAEERALLAQAGQSFDELDEQLELIERKVKELKHGV